MRLRKLIGMALLFVLFLTTAPLNTNALLSGPVATNVTSKWEKISGNWIFIVEFNLLNAPASGTISLIKKATASTPTVVIAEGGINARILGSEFNETASLLNYQSAKLSIAIDGNVISGGDDVIEINFFKVSHNIKDEYYSGETTTIDATVSLITDDAFGNVNLPNKVRVFDVKGNLIREIILTSTVPTTSKYYNIKVNNVKITGASTATSSEKAKITFNYNDTVLFQKEFAVKKGQFKFIPSTLTVDSAQSFKKRVYVTSMFNEPLPNNMVLDVSWISPTTATVVSDGVTSYFDLTLQTPTGLGTFTATLTANLTSNYTPTLIDGYGTLTVINGTGVVIGDITPVYQAGATRAISIYLSDNSTSISELKVNLTPLKSVARNIKVIDPVTSQVKTGTKDGDYTKYTGFQGNMAYIEFEAVQADDFNIDVVLKNSLGATYTANKSYSFDNLYKTIVLTGFKQIYGSTSTITVKVLTYTGTPVNNAKVVINNSYVDGKVENVNDGLYYLTISPTTNSGYYDINVYKSDDTLISIGNKMIYVEPQESYSIALNKNVVEIEEQITGTVLTGTAAVQNATVFVNGVNTNILTNANGVFTLNTLMDYFKVGANKIEVISNNRKGTVTVTVVLPALVVEPDITFLNEGLTNKIKVTGTKVGNVSLDMENATVAVTTMTATSEKTWIVTPQRTATNGTLTVVYNAGNRKFNVKSYSIVSNYKVEILTPTLVYNETTDINAKFTNNGIPVENVVLTLNIGFVTYTATTGTDGVAQFKDIIVSGYGYAVVTASVGNTTVSDRKAIMQNKPVSDLEVTMTPTVLDVSKNAVAIFTVKYKNNPVQMGLQYIFNVNGYTVTGLVSVNGLVYVEIPNYVLNASKLTGILKIEGYEPYAVEINTNYGTLPTVNVVKFRIGMDIYTFNGQSAFLDAAPYIKNNRTMVPVRALAEALGFKVTWDPAARSVQIYKTQQDLDNKKPFIQLFIGKNIAIVNQNMVTIDVAPEITSSRTFIPLRFVSEAFGASVNWISSTQEVVITATISR